MASTKTTPDVIILGGGLTGCLTALNLREAGRSCILIEPRVPISGASLHNAGGLYFQLQPDATTLGPLQQKQVGKLAPLVRSARTSWDRLNARLEGDIGTHWTGGVIVALNESQMLAIQGKQTFEAGLGITTSILNTSSLRELLPSVNAAALGACYSSTEGFCDPMQLAARVRKHLLQSGVQIITHRYKQVTFDTCYRITLDDGTEIETPLLISCLGAFTGGLLKSLGLPEAVEALPLQILEVSRPVDVSIPLFTRYAGSKLSLKQLPSGNILVGGGWSANPDPTDPLKVSFFPESAMKNLELARNVIPGLSGAKMESWRGDWAAWSRDGLPLIGGYQKFPGLYLAAGGNGYTLAPLYAELMADLACDRLPKIELDAFCPDRFTRASEEQQLPPDG